MPCLATLCAVLLKGSSRLAYFILYFDPNNLSEYIAEHLSARQVILQCRLKSQLPQGSCTCICCNTLRNAITLVKCVWYFYLKWHLCQEYVRDLAFFSPVCKYFCAFRVANYAQTLRLLNPKRTHQLGMVSVEHQ